MKFRTTALIKYPAIASALLLSSLTSFAAEKHLHGEAELFIAIEGTQVLIEMESPADNLLGFEHKPKTDKQKALVAKTNVLLQSHSNLIELDGGNCKQIDSFIESPFSDHKDEHKDEHNHNEKEHHDHGHEKHSDEEGTHSEFHITYTLECANSDAITAGNINAFKTFPNIEKIQAKWVNKKGQGSQVLTPKKVKVSF